MKKVGYYCIPFLMVVFCGCMDIVVGNWQNLLYKDVKLVSSNGITYLDIKGLYDSAHFVKKIVQINNGNSIEVLVYWTLLGHTNYKSGSFEYKVIITDEVNEVLFGKERDGIWKRSKPVKD
jgi:hypothetical protein